MHEGFFRHVQPRQTADISQGHRGTYLSAAGPVVKSPAMTQILAPSRTQHKNQHHTGRRDQIWNPLQIPHRSSSRSIRASHCPLSNSFGIPAYSHAYALPFGYTWRATGGHWLIKDCAATLTPRIWEGFILQLFHSLPDVVNFDLFFSPPL